jgi:hypothetical protein
MIRITELITYMRGVLPTWRIDGAAELSAAEDRSRLQLPAMYVMLGQFQATSFIANEFRQDYDERIVILLGLPNTQDRTGKYAQDIVTTARNALLTTLVNYQRLDSDSSPVFIVGDRIEEMDKARYWHRFEFKIEGTIGEEDVTQITLDKFDALYADWDLAEADESTYPNAQDIIKPLFFIPE